jgi:hypothetical protein
MPVIETPYTCIKCGRERPLEENGACPACGEINREKKITIEEKIVINPRGELKTTQKVRNTPIYIACWIVGIADIIIGYLLSVSRVITAIISVILLFIGMYLSPYGETIISQIQKF